MLNEEDYGRKIQLTQGESFSITLKSNPSTGFAWQIDNFDDAVIGQVGETEYIPSDQANQAIPGSGGEELFRFEALSPGETILKLIYGRSWEQNEEPTRVFIIEVIVRQ